MEGGIFTSLFSVLLGFIAFLLKRGEKHLSVPRVMNEDLIEEQRGKHLVVLPSSILVSLKEQGLSEAFKVLTTTILIYNIVMIKKL